VAARTIGATGLLSRSTNVPNYNSAYTLCCWHKSESSGAPTLPFILNIQNTAGTQWDGVVIDRNDARWELHTNIVANSSITSNTDGTWVHVAMVRASATSLTLYINGVAATTNNDSVGTSRTANYVSIGFVGFSGYQAHGDTCAVKMWDRALTAAEVAQEVHTITPRNVQSMNSWFPMLRGLRTREMLRGRDWTEAGTWSDADGPPVSWGDSLIIVGNPTGATIASGAGASAGVGAVAGVGRAIVAGAGASTGIATATAVGRATVAAAGAAAGTGAASGVGRAITAGAGAAAGVATATAVGAAIAAGAGSSAGVAAASATGARTAAAAGAAAGVATALAAGASTAAAVGSSAGTSAASGIAGAAEGVGAASGSSTAAAVGAAIAAGVGAASGSATALATGASTAAGAGAAAGVGTATGISAGFSAAVGVAAGSSTAAAVGIGIDLSNRGIFCGAMSASTRGGAMGAELMAGEIIARARGGLLLAEAC
jgi:hypothetical protein